jgi:hypothetical protein
VCLVGRNNNLNSGSLATNTEFATTLACTEKMGPGSVPPPYQQYDRTQSFPTPRVLLSKHAVRHQLSKFKSTLYAPFQPTRTTTTTTPAPTPIATAPKAQAHSPKTSSRCSRSLRTKNRAQHKMRDPTKQKIAPPVFPRINRGPGLLPPSMLMLSDRARSRPRSRSRRRSPACRVRRRRFQRGPAAVPAIRVMELRVVRARARGARRIVRMVSARTVDGVVDPFRGAVAVCAVGMNWRRALWWLGRCRCRRGRVAVADIHRGRPFLAGHVLLVLDVRFIEPVEGGSKIGLVGAVGAAACGNINRCHVA